MGLSRWAPNASYMSPYKKEAGRDLTQIEKRLSYFLPLRLKLFSFPEVYFVCFAKSQIHV